MKLEKIAIGRDEQSWLNRALSGFKFFGGLTVKELDNVMACVDLFHYPASTAVFCEGRPGDSMFVIYQGRVAVRKNKFFILSREVARLGPGEIFGEMALLHAAPRNATLKTLEDSKLFVLLAEDFRMLLDKSPDMARRMRHLADGRAWIERQR